MSSDVDDHVPQILPLRLAEHHMLQVLLPSFTLEWVHDGILPGVRMVAEFDDDTEAIRRRQARRAVRDRFGDSVAFSARVAALDTQIEHFFADPLHPPMKVEDPPFVFRYGNGGTLPILIVDEREYYCLPFRDIDPIGWNIANGGSDSRSELLNPLRTVARELREEISIIDPVQKRRYILDWDDAAANERPEALLARKFWQQKLGIDIGEFREESAAVTWIHGADCIVVRTPGEVERETKGIILNISAADFAIEIDRVARIHVASDAVVLDGETCGGELVDRAMGLFEVERFSDAFSRGDVEFLPDILFLSGVRVDGDETAMRSALLAACAPGQRPLRSDLEDREWLECDAKFRLCPVTAQVVGRHLKQEGRVADYPRPGAGQSHFDAFISVCGDRPDVEIGEQIYRALSKERRVFYYKEEVYGLDLMRSIEDALEKADVLFVVCTSNDRIRRLDFEWVTFWNWTRYGRKPRGRIVPIVFGMKPVDLPPVLCNVTPVPWSPDDPESSVANLMKSLR